MGIIKRQSLKTSIVNYAGVIIGVVFFNFLFPHLVHEKYLGLLGLLQNLTLVLAAFPALGLGHVLLRYVPVWKEENTIARFHRFALIAMSIALLVFALLFFIFKENLITWYAHQSPLFVPYAFLILPLVAIFTYTQYFELFAMVRMRLAVPSFLREIVVRILLIALLYAFAVQWINEIQWVYGIVTVYAISGISLIVYTVKVLNFKLEKNSRFADSRKEKVEVFQYAGVMLMMLAAGNLHNFIDGIILPAYLGLGALGIYMRPLVLGQMIQVPYRAISQISIPVIREAMVDNDIDKVRDLNKSIGINLFLIGSFLFAGLAVCADPLFAMLPEQYAEGKYVLYIVGFGRLLDMAFGINSEILNYSNYYRLMLYLTLLMMAITIGLDIILIPLWGMNGAALAVSISLTLFNILKSVFIYKRFRFHCFSKHYITLSLIMFAVIAVLQYIPILPFIDQHRFINAALNVVFKATLSSLAFLVPVYLFKVSPDLNEFIKLIISGRIFKGGHKMESL